MKTSKIIIVILFCLSAMAQAKKDVSPEIRLFGGYADFPYMPFFADEFYRDGLGFYNGTNVGIKAGLNISSFDVNVKFRRYYYKADGKYAGRVEPHYHHHLDIKGETELEINTFSFGIEWNIRRHKKISPFIYCDYLPDCDTDVKILKIPTGPNLPASYANIRTDFSFSENNRSGYAFGAGIEIKILPHISAGILVEQAKFPKDQNDPSNDSIYSKVLPQENISIMSVNALLSFEL